MKKDSKWIIGKDKVFQTPWVTVVEKSVSIPHSGEIQKYCSMELPDFVLCLAILPDGKIPIVRQYRSGVESWTWELPSGHVDIGETPEDGAIRELHEETGVRAVKTIALPRGFADVGRISNTCHPFLFEGIIDENAKLEEGVERRFVKINEIKDMIKKEEFSVSLHIATLAMSLWYFPKIMSRAL